MAFNRSGFSLRHLLMLVYILSAVLLTSLLVHEHLSGKPSFSLSHASTKDSQNAAVLSVYGEAFHDDIKVVSTKTLLNEEALLWKLLDGVSSKAIDIRGDIALLACSGNKLVSIRLHEGKRPEILGSIQLPAIIREIKIVGDQAVVGMGRHKGLALVNLREPGDLKVVRTLREVGLLTSMVVKGETIYYTDTFKGIGRIDLSAENPVPEILFSVKGTWRIAIQGKRLVVASVKGRMLLFDITQGGGLVESGQRDFRSNVRGVVFIGETLVVALADGTTHFINQSLWPSMQKIAQMELPGSPIQIERVPQHERIVVSMIAGGVVVVDVSQPTLPTLIGNLKRPRTFIDGKVHNKNFFGVSQVGLEIISLDKITSGENATLATEAMINRDHYELITWNNHVYGLSKSLLSDLGEIDATDHESSLFMAAVEEEGVGLFTQDENKRVARVDTLQINGVKDVTSKGEYLYVLSLSGLRIYMGTRPEELFQIGELQLPGRPKSFDLLDSGYLLITNYDHEVLVVNVNDPRLPLQVANVSTPLHLQTRNIVQEVLTDGNRAYISYGAGGVNVFDMRVPSRPELKQIIDTPGHAKHMMLHDDLLFVADGSQGLFMIDVADRAHSLPVGTLPTPLRIDQMAPVDDGLIVSGHPGGTMRLPLPKRTKQLQRVNDSEMRVEIEALEKGQYLYLYDKGDTQQVKVEI